MFIANELRLDPVLVVTETNLDRRAVRLAAAQVLIKERDKQAKAAKKK